MSEIQSRRLRDILVRQQLFVEQIRVGQLNQFDIFAEKLSKELVELLSHLQYRNMDGLTKVELKNFVSSLRKNQLKLWNEYIAEMITNMEDFMLASKRMDKRIFASVAIQFNAATNRVTIPDEEESERILEAVEDEEDNSPLFGWLSLRKSEKGDARMWAYLYHSMIPANGMTMYEFLVGMSLQSMLTVENVIKQAYVNGWSIPETIENLIGTKALRFNDGVMHRIKNSNAAVMSTIVLHVASQVSVSVQSAYFEKYIWLSVMDNRTSKICIGLNGRIFEYKRGPLPPAHMYCRSKVSPYLGGDIADETLYNWLVRQPQSVVSTLFSGTIAARIANGDPVAQMVNDFKTETALQIADYDSVIDTILTP